MNTLHADGRDIALDKDGFLQQLEDWSPAVAGELAAREGIALGDSHWAVLHALRDFYQEFQLSPATRPLVKYTATRLGADVGNSATLNRLFNGTPAKLAAKLAGLPKPTNCI